MLHILVAPLSKLIAEPSFIRYPMVYFDGVWEYEWLEDDFGRRVIQGIDRAPLGSDVQRSLLEHGMRVEDLCTGTKNLLLCKHLDGMINRMTMMGENCYPFLLEAAETKDIIMGCPAYALIRDEYLQGRQVHFINDNTTVSSQGEFLFKMIDFQAGGLFDD